jgi:hypothetical protein
VNKLKQTLFPIDKYFFAAMLFFIIPFFNLSLFSVYAFFLLFLNQKKFSKYNIIFKITTLLFYLLRYVSSLSVNYNKLWKSLSLKNYASDERFWDLQLNLISMKCIFGNVDTYYIKYSLTSYKSCPYTAEYGPLSTKVPFFGDIWIGTQLLALVAIIVLLISYLVFTKKFPENTIFFSSLMLISPTNFLVERMNIDLFIGVIIVFSLVGYIKYPKVSISLITLLALYKLHPLGILFGLLLNSVLQDNKQRRDHLYNALFIFLTVYLLDVIFFTNQVLDTEWRPAGLHITFGLLSDSLIVEKLTTINYLYVYLVALISIGFLTVFTDFTTKINFQNFSSIEKTYYYSFTFLFLLNMLYANYDYRIPLFFPVVYLIFTHADKRIWFIFLFIYLMPLDTNINGLDANFTIIGNVFSILGRISLYSFLIINLQLIKQDLLGHSEFKLRFFTKK